MSIIFNKHVPRDSHKHVDSFWTETDSPDTNKWQTTTLRALFRRRRKPMYSVQNIIFVLASLQSSGVRRIILIVLLVTIERRVVCINNWKLDRSRTSSLTHRWLPSNQPCPHLWQSDCRRLRKLQNLTFFYLALTLYLPNHKLSTNYTCLFDVRVTVHRRHSEGKEPTRCYKICSFIASTCFGHQYAHRREYNYW
jgi:hypothetical protein